MVDKLVLKLGTEAMLLDLGGMRDIFCVCFYSTHAYTIYTHTHTHTYDIRLHLSCTWQCARTFVHVCTNTPKNTCILRGKM